jgi:hypothetical protein
MHVSKILALIATTPLAIAAPVDPTSREQALAATEGEQPS